MAKGKYKPNGNRQSHFISALTLKRALSIQVVNGIFQVQGTATEQQ